MKSISLNKILILLIFTISYFIQIYIALFLSLYTRELLGNVGLLEKLNLSIDYFIPHFVYFSLIFIAIMIYEKIYVSRNSFWEEAKKMVKTVSLWVLIIFAYLSITKEIETFSRAVVLILWGYSIVLSPLFHYLTKIFLIKTGIFQIPVVIVGAGKAGKSIAEEIVQQPYLGYKIEGFFDDAPIKSVTVKSKEFPVLGKLVELESYLEKDNVWTAIMAIPSLSAEKASHLINFLYRKTREVIVVPNISEIPVANIELLSLFNKGLVSLKLKNNLKSLTNRIFKRSFDIVLSIILLPFILILCVIIGIAIKIDSPGPAILRQKRLGKDGKVFECYKFRTMYKDADEKLKEILEKDPEKKKEWETYWKLRDDPRITPVGKFLRRTSLDELPQILNVLKGEMSLIGPRPYLPREWEYIKNESPIIHSIPPGITGLWQVSVRNKENYQYRIAMDTWYVLNWSLWLDIVILIKTIKVVLTREGAY